MKNAALRPTMVESPSPELLKATTEESGVHRLAEPITLPPEESRPTLEMPFLKLVQLTVKELERQAGLTQMEAEEKQRLFPIFYAMPVNRELATLVLKEAFLYGEPYTKQVRDEKWLMSRLVQTDPATLLEYIRDVVPLLHLDLPEYPSGEKLDQSDADYEDEERRIAMQRVMGDEQPAEEEERVTKVMGGKRR